MALLEITNLSVTVYEQGQAIKLIDNFSLTLNQGDLVGLIGETGSGKSVIAQILGGFVKPDWRIDCSSFRFNGRELLKDAHTIDTQYLSSNVGIIHQDPANIIDPSQTIGKQITARLKMRSDYSWFKRKQLHKELVELLRWAGFKDAQDLLSSYYSELSQTEAHLIAMVMALVTQPLFIVADEPTTGLNSVAQLRVQGLFRRLNANGNKTILYMSNNYLAIRGVVKTAHMLYLGQIVERFYNLDRIETRLLAHAHHPYTRLFLQSLPNFADDPLVYKGQLFSLPGQLPAMDNLPVGCRFGPRCEFAQRECMKFPAWRRDRVGDYSEFACHHPVNFEDEESYNLPLLQRLRKQKQTGTKHKEGKITPATPATKATNTSQVNQMHKEAKGTQTSKETKAKSALAGAKPDSKSASVAKSVSGAKASAQAPVLPRHPNNSHISQISPDPNNYLAFAPTAQQLNDKISTRYRGT